MTGYPVLKKSKAHRGPGRPGRRPGGGRPPPEAGRPPFAPRVFGPPFSATPRRSFFSPRGPASPSPQRLCEAGASDLRVLLSTKPPTLRSGARRSWRADAARRWSAPAATSAPTGTTGTPGCNTSRPRPPPARARSRGRPSRCPILTSSRAHQVLPETRAYGGAHARPRTRTTHARIPKSRARARERAEAPAALRIAQRKGKCS